MSREAMDIEDVLCSKIRLKILELLMKSELLNTSEIAKQVGVIHSKAKEHLKILEDEGILIYRMFGSRTRLLDARENVSARRKHPPERALACP
jgi:predicted transcriptional regulator